MKRRKERDMKKNGQSMVRNSLLDSKWAYNIHHGCLQRVNTHRETTQTVAESKLNNSKSTKQDAFVGKLSNITIRSVGCTETKIRLVGPWFPEIHITVLSTSPCFALFSSKVAPPILFP